MPREDDPSLDREVIELFERCRDPESPRVDHVLRVHGLHAGGLAAHVALYSAVMRGTASFRKVDRELVAFVVSKLNGCHY